MTPLPGDFTVNARKAWLCAGVTMQQDHIANAAWELMKQYPSVAAAMQAIRDEVASPANGRGEELFL